MVETIGSTVELRGLSTDEKPTANLPVGSTYREFDGGVIWEFSEKNINPATGNGWWEV
jgi:hypothetical protein